jgi:hypothetical protein
MKIRDDAGAWVDEEFETLDLGDPRRDRRAKELTHGTDRSVCFRKRGSKDHLVTVDWPKSTSRARLEDLVPSQDALTGQRAVPAAASRDPAPNLVDVVTHRRITP